MTVERKDRVTFRLLEMHDQFYDYIDSNDELEPSKAMRHFIKNGLLKNGGFTIGEKEHFKSEIILLKRSLMGVGVNLNQIAKYFNQSNKVNESNLKITHNHLQENQKKITFLLNHILAKL